MAATWVADSNLICAEEMSAISALLTVAKSYDLIRVAGALSWQLISNPQLQLQP